MAVSVLRRDEATVDWLSERLLTIAASVPSEIDGFRLEGGSEPLSSDSRLFDFEAYPEQLWKKPGDKAPNRQRSGHGGRTSMPRRNAPTVVPSSLPALLTLPNRRTSRDSRRTLVTSRVRLVRA